MNKILLHRIGSNLHLQIRSYAFKSDLKIKWVRPEKLLCTKPQKSGDQANFPSIDLKQYALDYQHSKELTTASEPVQRLFQLGFSRRRNQTEYYSAHLVKSVQRHELDHGSMEVKLADLTGTIRSLQQQLEKYPGNKKLQVICKEMIDCRKKYIRHLRIWDYKRFEWVLEKLDLIYKSYPKEHHWITRKESLTKLTALHCGNIREERIDAYRQVLKSQQTSFLQEKLKNLQYIMTEQKECAVPITVTADEINELNTHINALLLK